MDALTDSLVLLRLLCMGALIEEDKKIVKPPQKEKTDSKKIIQKIKKSAN